MFLLPFGERRKSNKEKFQSRKYRTILFWNALTVVSILIQSLFAYTGKNIELPLNIIIGITGVLNAEYLGVNLMEKKIIGNPLIQTPTSTEKK